MTQEQFDRVCEIVREIDSLESAKKEISKKEAESLLYGQDISLRFCRWEGYNGKWVKTSDSGTGISAVTTVRRYNRTDANRAQQTWRKEWLSIAYLFPKKWEERFGGVGKKM